MALSAFSGAASATGETEGITDTEQISDRPGYDVTECVDLGGYLELRVDISKVTVTEEDVLLKADALIRDSQAMLPAAKVQESDVVNISYTGTLDGEEFEGGSDEGYMLTIGSGTFIEGFEEGLIGVGVGNTVDLVVNFPEDYYLDNLAGRDVVFTVTVKEILREPELTDEVVREVTDGEFTDIESWFSSLRTGLEEEAQEARQDEIRDKLCKALAENSVITDYPEELAEYLFQKELSFYESLPELYPPATFDEIIAAFGYTQESFDDLLRSQVQEKVERELLLMTVASYQSMTLTDEEYQDGVEEYMLKYDYKGTDKEFEEEYAQIYGDEQLGIDLLMDKVLNYLEENALITETETENAEEGTEY